MIDESNLKQIRRFEKIFCDSVVSRTWGRIAARVVVQYYHTVGAMNESRAKNFSRVS